jgi:hypothetical protein
MRMVESTSIVPSNTSRTEEALAAQRPIPFTSVFLTGRKIFLVAVIGSVFAMVVIFIISVGCYDASAYPGLALPP